MINAVRVQKEVPREVGVSAFDRGELFLHEDTVYMRLGSLSEIDQWACINMTTGAGLSMDGRTLVTPLKGQLNVQRIDYRELSALREQKKKEQEELSVGGRCCDD